MLNSACHFLIILIYLLFYGGEDMGIFLRKIPFCTLLCIFLSALFLSTPVWALEELKVGYVPGTGFLDEDRPGHMRGNGYEYMEFLSGFLGAKFTYIPCVNWWEAGAKLENMEIDLLPAMPGNYKTLPFAMRTDHVLALICEPETKCKDTNFLRHGKLFFAITPKKCIFAK